MSNDEAMAILAAPDSYASVRPIEPQGVSITVIAQKTNFVPVAIFGTVVGLLVLFAGIYLLRHPQSEWQQGPLASAPLKLILFGALGSALAPMILVIQLVNGPARNVELEAVPGTLKADRSIAGDRVVSTYHIEDVGCIFLENDVLCIETRKGHSQLIAFGRRRINEAVAVLVARQFWSPLEIDVVRRAQRVMGHRIAKTVLIPKVEVE